MGINEEGRENGIAIVNHKKVMSLLGRSLSDNGSRTGVIACNL